MDWVKVLTPVLAMAGITYISVELIDHTEQVESIVTIAVATIAGLAGYVANRNNK